MRKYRLAILTAVFMLLNVCAYADTIKTITYDGKTMPYNAKEVHVIVDGKELTGLDMPAIILEDRTLVPLRAIFESMGGKVDWNGEQKKITADVNGNAIVMVVNNKEGSVNGNGFTMDVAPKIINDRTMVPVRAIAEAIGSEVFWDSDTRTVRIETMVIGKDDGQENAVIGSDSPAQPEPAPVNPSPAPANPVPVSPTDSVDIPYPDPQKVTNLSHVDESEIDTEALADARNSVNVTSVDINGNDSYTIKTSGRIWQYRYATVLGKKVAVDIYGGTLAVSSTNIPVNDEPVERIRIAQNAVEPYKIVRVVFDLTGTAGDYRVTKSADGTSLTVNFGNTAGQPATPPPSDNITLPPEPELNSVNGISVGRSGNSDIINISAAEKPDYKVFALYNPYRIVVDINDSKLNVAGIPDVSGADSIKSIRASQFSDSQVRIVITPADGVEYSSSANGYNIRLSLNKPVAAVEITQTLVNDGMSIRFTKAGSLKASDMTKSYDPYTGNTVISLNGDYSKEYGNKVLTYNNDNPEASYISSAKFATKDGKTSITVTPSLIAEYNIYENGDYIYIDLVDPKTVYDAVVVLDAGHGGTMPGAVVNGVYEKNVTLDIAKRAYNLLSGDNIKVYVTRFNDSYVDNHKRAYMANYGADMFISIHCNSISGDVDIHGTETLYAPHTGEGNGGLTSYTLANTLQRYVSKTAGTYNRGVKNRSDLIVLNRTTVPAALVETGFMTDKNDMALLTSESGRQKFASAIHQAVKEVLQKNNFR